MIVLILKPLDSLNYILLFYLGVIGVHLVNSGPDMLLLLLKAPTNNSAPFSLTIKIQC